MQIFKLRKYEEIKIEVLMEKVKSNPFAMRHMPELPPSHPIQKQYLLAV